MASFFSYPLEDYLYYLVFRIFLWAMIIYIRGYTKFLRRKRGILVWSSSFFRITFYFGTSKRYSLETICSVQQFLRSFNFPGIRPSDHLSSLGTKLLHAFCDHVSGPVINLCPGIILLDITKCLPAPILEEVCILCYNSVFRSLWEKTFRHLAQSSGKLRIGLVRSRYRA